jgi:hypothetical protein
MTSSSIEFSTASATHLDDATRLLTGTHSDPHTPKTTLSEALDAAIRERNVARAGPGTLTEAFRSALIGRTWLSAEVTHLQHRLLPEDHWWHR